MKMKVTFCLVLLAVVATIHAMPQSDDKNKQGGFVFDVNKERGDGAKVKVDARQEFLNKNDGRTRGEVYGHWDRTYGGRNDGDRSHGGGVRIEHSWGKR